MENENLSGEVARARIAEMLRQARQPRPPQVRRRRDIGRRHRTGSDRLDN
jgi:hypothetical protein